MIKEICHSSTAVCAHCPKLTWGRESSQYKPTDGLLQKNSRLPGPHKRRQIKPNQQKIKLTNRLQSFLWKIDQHMESPLQASLQVTYSTAGTELKKGVRTPSLAHRWHAVNEGARDNINNWRTPLGTRQHAAATTHKRHQ